MPARFYTIQEAAKKIGVSSDTLRRWDAKGALSPKRTPGGQRRYSELQIESFLVNNQEAQQKGGSDSKLSVASELPTLTSQPQGNGYAQFLTIQEAASVLGISAKTLRRWDAQGKLTPIRTPGGQRRYSNEQLQKALGKNEEPEQKTKLAQETIGSVPQTLLQAVQPEQVEPLIPEPLFIEHLARAKAKTVFVKKNIALHFSNTFDAIPKTVKLFSLLLFVSTALVLFAAMLTRYTDRFDGTIAKPLLTMLGKTSEQEELMQKEQARKERTRAVLAAQANRLQLSGTIAFNLPATFNEDVTAPNVVYEVTGGSGITIAGGQTPTITNTDLGSSQKIFGNIKLGSDTATAASNTDTFEFAAGSNVSLSLDKTNKKLTITSTDTTGSGDITAVSVGNGLSGGGTSGDVTVSLDVTTTSTSTTTTANSGLETASSGLSLLRGCSDSQVLQWDATNVYWECASAGGAFTLAGDSGTSQTISGSDTLTIAGGTNGIDTVASSTDTITLNFDSTEVGTTTWGAGSAFTWTFDAGATDPTIAFGSNAITLGSSVVTISGSADGTDALVLTAGDILVSNGDLDLSGGDFNVTLDAGDGASITSAAAATADAFTTTLTGVGSDALQINLTQSDDDDSTDNSAALRLALTSSSGDADLLYGIDIGNISEGTAIEVAMRFGSGWTNLIEFEGATNNDFEAFLQITDPTADRTYTLPDASGEICLVSAGNCAGSGTGVTTTGGTENRLAKFTGTQAVGNSTITDDGTSIGISIDVDITFIAGENLSLTNTSASTDQLNISVSGVTTSDANGIELAFTQADDADAGETNAAINVTVTGDSDNADTLIGVNIANLAGASAAANSYALQIGSGWDSNVYFNDTTSRVLLADGGTIVIHDGTNTLCTITDNVSVGDLTCTGSITGGTSGTQGHWSRTSTTLSPATANDIVSVSSNNNTNATLAITNNTADTIGASSAIGVVDFASTSLTTGALLNLELTEGTLNGGYYLRAWDATAGSAVFSVGEDGATTIAGLEGSTMFTLTAGDAAVSDGSLSITDDDDAVSLGVTNNTATTVGAGVNTSGVIDFSSTSLTTGNLLNLETTTALTSGRVLNASSTTTSSSFSGNIGRFEWLPGSATTASADLLLINIGANGTTTGNLLNITDAGSSLFSVSETALTSSLPSNFTAAGDVSIAYDIVFTNPTVSYIKSPSPLHIVSGEPFNSSNLALQTYNAGSVTISPVTGVSTSTTGLLRVDGTSATSAYASLYINTVFNPTAASTSGYGIYNAFANTNATNADTAYGSYTTLTDAIALGNTNYGDYITVSNTGALNAAATKTIYGQYISASGTGATTNASVATTVYGIFATTAATHASDNGTVNNYVLYIDDGTSSTNGTNTKFGLYLEPMTAADENIGICFDCDSTFGTSTVATGIRWGNETTTTQNLEIFRSNGAAAAQITIQDEAGTDIMNASVDTFQINLSAQTGSGQRICQDGADGSTGLETIGDCDAGGADIAELYGSDGTLEAGDIVIPSQTQAYETTTRTGKFTTKAFVEKSGSSYQNNIIGIISTNPFGEVLGEGIFAQNEHPVPVALAGRVPVKVSTENGPIAVGDYLSSSSTPGVAMKATQSGQVIGKALQSYGASGIGKIVAFVNVSFADPNGMLASLVIGPNGNVVSTDLASKGDAFQGSVNVLGTQTTTASAQLTPTPTATPSATPIVDLSNDPLFAAMQTEIASLSAKIALLQDSIVQSASTSAFLQSATTSALLNPTINTTELEEVYTENVDAGSATISGTLNVLGRTTLTDLGVTGDIIAGVTTIKGLDGEINTLAGPLRLQGLALQGVELVGGKVTIDTKGNIVAKSITVEEIKIVKGTTTGSAAIASGAKSVDIASAHVTANSRIFVTATTETTVPLAVVARKSGQRFTVSVPLPTAAPITFDWWIVNEQ